MARIFPNTDHGRTAAYGLHGEIIRRHLEGSIPEHVLLELLQSVAYWKLPCQVKFIGRGTVPLGAFNHDYVQAWPGTHGFFVRQGDEVVHLYYDGRVSSTTYDPQYAPSGESQIRRMVPHRQGVIVVTPHMIMAYGVLGGNYQLFEGPTEGKQIVLFGDDAACGVIIDQDHIVFRSGTGSWEAPSGSLPSQWKTHPLGIMEYQPDGWFVLHTSNGQVIRKTDGGVIDWWYPHQLGVVYRRGDSFFLRTMAEPSDERLLFSGRWERLRSRGPGAVDCLCTPTGIYVVGASTNPVASPNSSVLTHCTVDRREEVFVINRAWGSELCEVNSLGQMVIHEYDGELQLYAPGQSPRMLYPGRGVSYTFMACDEGAIINIDGGYWLVSPLDESAK